MICPNVSAHAVRPAVKVPTVVSGVATLALFELPQPLTSTATMLVKTTLNLTEPTVSNSYRAVGLDERGKSPCMMAVRETVLDLERSSASAINRRQRNSRHAATSQRI
jgi:hypothetical protein